MNVKKPPQTLESRTGASNGISLRSSEAFTQTAQFCFLLGATLTAFEGLLVLVSSALLLTGNPLECYHIPLAAVLSALFCWWGAGQYFPQARRRMFLITSTCAAGAFVAFAVLSGLLYDTSWDGQNYHTEAILQLADGWNPFYEAPTDAIYPQLLEFFSKGPWISATALYKLTENFEQGKAFHLLLILAAYLLCVAAFSSFRAIKRRWVFLLSALMAFNPVSITQMFTFYVDGLLSSALVITICLFILLYRQPSRVLMVTLASTIIITVNIKLSGAIYAAVLGASYGIWYLFHKRQRRAELAAWLAAGYFIGTLMIGYNPYITQYTSKFLSTGNPFYPSDWKTFIHLDYNTPGNFLSMEWGEMLLTSLFSKSQATSAPSQFKWPFTVTSDEILSFSAPDVRVAGFGPLFGGALLLTLGLLVTALARYWHRLMLASSLLFLLAVVLISGLLNSEAWWARYVPQLWMVPLLTILLIMSAVPRGKLYLLSRIVAVILCANQLLIALPYVINAVGQSILLTEQLLQLKNAEGKIAADFNYFVSTEIRFQEWGIDYQSIDELPCSIGQQMQIIGTETRICLPLSHYS